MSKLRKPIVLFSLVLPGTFATLSLLATRVVEQEGDRFYETGRRITGMLDQFAGAVRARKSNSMDRYFTAKYVGRFLGLTGPELIETKDEVRRWTFNGGASASRAQALSEWSDYLGGFSSIEEAGFHIDRLEKWEWNHETRAIVRMEVIGTIRGETRSLIDRVYLDMLFEFDKGDFRIAGAYLQHGERIFSERPQFVEVGRQAGIAFLNRYYPGFLNTSLKFGMIRYGPGGISAVDYDNDGFYDLFIPDGVECKLFRNLGNGTFEDVTAKAGLAGLDGVSVAVFADYDNDGYKDVFVSRTFKPNQLFHNNRDGTFTDVTAKSGIGADCCTTVASWADYDLDGYLDLYVGRYLDPRKDIPTTFYARNGEPNQLYRNNGDGTFTNVTKQAGVGDTGSTLGTVFGDYDGDGYPDLYVVNDFGRKTLYHNNGDRTFTDVTVKAGALAYGAGMSASMADYDNDGLLDIYSTNIRSEHAWYASSPTVNRYMVNSWRQGVWKTDMPLYWEIFRQSGLEFVNVFQQMASGNTLLRNRGDGTFEDTTWKANANPIGWFWGASFADFDNDGWQDIYAALGWVRGESDTEIELEFLNNVVTQQALYKTGMFFDPTYFGTRSWHGWERNRHLRNNGDGTFTEIGRGAGTDLLKNSRGVAVADFWNRGRMDIAVSASTDTHALLRNEIENSSNWLQVELVGTESNRDAVGARVTAITGGKLQMREVVLGDGYGSQNSLRQHFGLGSAFQVDELTVRWPRSKRVQAFHNVAVNRIIQITEGNDAIIEKHYGRRMAP